MRKILILFAHPLEAAPTLAALNAKELSPGHYSFERGRIAITGMGPDNAAAHTVQTGVDEIWNLGLAGALNPSLPIGSIHPIGQISREGHPSIALGPGAHLFTSPVPVWHPIDTLADLVDMEGHAIASTTSLPIKMWKIVSDHTEPDGQKFLKQRIHALSKPLAELVSTELNR